MSLCPCWRRRPGQAVLGNATLTLIKPQHSSAAGGGEVSGVHHPQEAAIPKDTDSGETRNFGFLLYEIYALLPRFPPLKG